MRTLLLIAAAILLVGCGESDRGQVGDLQYQKVSIFNSESGCHEVLLISEPTSGKRWIASDEKTVVRAVPK